MISTDLVLKNVLWDLTINTLLDVERLRNPAETLIIDGFLGIKRDAQDQARREGESFLGPRDVLGAPPSLKNTENGVPDGFFMT